MQNYSLSHLDDAVLLRDLAVLVSQDRATTASLLAHIAEVDERRLYASTEFPSMHAYSVGRLRMSEDAAAKRIQAARAARKAPAIFAMLADGRLSLSVVCLLAPHLTRDTAAELLAGATHRTRKQVELLLAERFPRPGVVAWPEPNSAAVVAPTAATTAAAVAGHDEPKSAAHVDASSCQHAPGHVAPSLTLKSAKRVVPVIPRARIRPVSPGLFELEVLLAQATHDKLLHARALLGHAVPTGDIAQVLDRALDALIERLEKRKFGAPERARPARQAGAGPGGDKATGERKANKHYIPAAIRREVKRRDGERCTFVAGNGNRCEARTPLETLWNDGLAVVASSCLREEKPTAVARGHLDRGLAPAAPGPHTRGARREHERYHLRRDGRPQEGDQRGDASAGEERVDRVAAGQRAGCDSAPGEEAAARSAR